MDLEKGMRTLHTHVTQVLPSFDELVQMAESDPEGFEQFSPRDGKRNDRKRIRNDATTLMGSAKPY